MNRFVRIILGFVFLLPLLGNVHAASSPKEITARESPELHDKLREAYAMLKERGVAVPISEYKLRIVRAEPVNALVFPPTKTIVFTNTLIDRFTADEISLILCHEIAHVKLGHYGKRVAVSWGASLLMKALDMAIPGAGILEYFFNPAVTMTFSRSQEIDADIEAARIMKTTFSRSPEEYVKVLEKLRDESLRKGYRESDRGGLLDTHPNIAHRVAKIREQARKNQW